MGMKCPSATLFINIAWQYIMLHISMTIPACSLGPIAWKNFSTALYSEEIAIFNVRICFMMALQ